VEVLKELRKRASVSSRFKDCVEILKDPRILTRVSSRFKASVRDRGIVINLKRVSSKFKDAEVILKALNVLAKVSSRFRESIRFAVSLPTVVTSVKGVKVSRWGRVLSPK